MPEPEIESPRSELTALRAERDRLNEEAVELRKRLVRFQNEAETVAGVMDSFDQVTIEAQEETAALRAERDELLTASKTLLGRYSGHDKGDWLPAYHAWAAVVHRLAREISNG